MQPALQLIFMVGLMVLYAPHGIAGHTAMVHTVLSHYGCDCQQVEFTGSLIVVPDISIATAPGERITTKFGAASSCRKTACRALLVRLSCSVQLRELAAAAAPEGHVLTNLCRGLKEGARAHRHGSDGDAVAGCAGADLQAVLCRLLHHGTSQVASLDSAYDELHLKADCIVSDVCPAGIAPPQLLLMLSCLLCCRGRRHRAAWSTSGRTRS